MEYGQPQEVPLFAVGRGLLHDLAIAGEISGYDGDPVYVENVEGIKSYLVHTYGKDGYVNGNIFVVVVEDAGRAGVTGNGENVWLDAKDVEEAVRTYKRGAV
ncbi:hypothetical protein MNR02_14825 [Shinella sp. H4-D48]|uniref:hypothetical protein n=1 Tax=Shinella sp. H4-D48 TaxID=2925841 RepID=UPI001F532803|nr:hypothetical protein [Shinella sp. H4-D48]UNK37722.1 hypothetical protein MNR02_14825 [Shinella sp. H4-D48]